MKLLITPISIEKEFLRLMKQHQKYFWACAWAGIHSECFDKLVLNQKKINKIVVGTHFYQTHPDFIKKFLNSKKIKFISQTDELFHPKIYLFESYNKWELLIGSANFTKAAFLENTEAVFLLNSNDVDSGKVYFNAKKIIEDNWKKAKSFTIKDLANYKLIWDKQKVNINSLGNSYGLKKRKPIHESSITTMTWADYYRNIKNNKYLNHRLKVLSFIRSFFEKINPDKKFNDLSLEERKAIAGTLSFNHSMDLYGVEMKFFGSMSGNGEFAKQIIHNNINITKGLEEIPLFGKIEKSHYLSACNHFEKVNQMKLATCTRLLAMKRPDVFVCVDGANRKKLCEDFGLIKSKLICENYWDEIIERIYDSIWWNIKAPNGKQEFSVWQGRTALLDVIYYL